MERVKTDVSTDVKLSSSVELGQKCPKVLKLVLNAKSFSNLGINSHFIRFTPSFFKLDNIIFSSIVRNG